jgi:transcriptional regulator with XRE-family HTH domain
MPRRSLLAQDTTIDEIVGANCKMLRLKADMSQAELADHLGVTFQQVQKYESGSNRVAASTLHNMSKILDCEVIEFFEGLSTKTRPHRFSKDQLAMLKIYESLSSKEIRRHVKSLMKALATSKYRSPC